MHRLELYFLKYLDDVFDSKIARSKRQREIQIGAAKAYMGN
jgi:hypothetical protein